MLDHDNLEEFADPHNYDIEDSSDTGVLLRQYGDWNLEPLTAASPSIIVVGRKRA